MIKLVPKDRANEGLSGGKRRQFFQAFHKKEMDRHGFTGNQ